jgi:glycosyltransferase involved in cell wall biosynthesis
MAKTINSLKYKLSILLSQARVEKNGKARVYDYKKYLPKSNSKPQKSLVSYLVDPVIDDLSGISTGLFSNNGAGRTIPKVLNELGYVVDIINWDDTRPIQGEYDLVIFHGGKNFEQIKKLNKPNNKLVYYSTGSYWQYHNTQEQKRLDYFHLRHNKKYKLDREIQDAEEDANTSADAIIALGNQDTASTYAKFKHVYNLEGASMPIANPRSIQGTETDNIGFLFMAGPGNLHKGLDIILDAWAKLPKNLHLHIITYLDDDFVDYYRNQLYDSPNIHTHGYVMQRSEQYYDIIKDCQFSVLLSCSEGSPGSVIESMHQGLIPIISRESHVNIDNHGYVLKKNNMEELEDLILSLSSLKQREIVKSQQELRDWTQKEFTVQKYEQELIKIIKDITK